MSASESTGFAGGGGASKSLCGIRECPQEPTYVEKLLERLDHAGKSSQWQYEHQLLADAKATISALVRMRDEDEATAIAALQRNLELRRAIGRRPSAEDIAKIVSRRLASSNREFTTEDAAEAILGLFQPKQEGQT